MLVIISALISGSITLVNEIKGYRHSEKLDMLASREKRFAGLKEVLPLRGVIGYVSDQPPDNVNREHFSAQYVLAPIIVTNERTHRYVVGDFRNPSGEHDLFRSEDYKILKKSEDGVILFEMK